MRVGVLLLLLGVAGAEPSGSVRGRALDPDGKARARVLVTAFCVSTDEPLSRAARTGEDGGFLIEGLPPGDYLLEVGEPRLPTAEELIVEKVSPGFREKMAHVARVAGAIGSPHRVKVKAGDTVVHDIREPRKVPVTVRLEREGKPLANVAVELYALDDLGLPVLAIDLGARKVVRTTDARGEIAFQGVAEGTYGVFVHVGEWSVKCAQVDVDAKAPLDLPLALADHRVKLRVIDARGKPVTAAEPGLTGVWLRESEPIASATGVYTIPCLKEGIYQPRVIVDGVLAKGEPFPVGAATPDPEVTLRLPETGSLVVRVVDGAGKPLAGVLIEVERSPDGIPCLQHESDSKGEVRIKYLPVGTWLVRQNEAAREVEVKAFAETKITLK